MIVVETLASISSRSSTGDMEYFLVLKIATKTTVIINKAIIDPIIIIIKPELLFVSWIAEIVSIVLEHSIIDDVDFVVILDGFVVKLPIVTVVTTSTVVLKSIGVFVGIILVDVRSFGSVFIILVVKNGDLSVEDLV